MNQKKNEEEKNRAVRAVVGKSIRFISNKWTMLVFILSAYGWDEYFQLK